MHKNFVWLTFLSIITLIAFTHSVNTALATSDFYNISTPTVAHISSWEIQKKGNSKYLLKAQYSYSDGKNTYSNESTLSSHIFKNEWTANSYIQKHSGKYDAWFQKDKPHISVLERHFPFKQLIYSTLLCGILVYFFWLGYYVSKIRN